MQYIYKHEDDLATAAELTENIEIRAPTGSTERQDGTYRKTSGKKNLRICGQNLFSKRTSSVLQKIWKLDKNRLQQMRRRNGCAVERWHILREPISEAYRRTERRKKRKMPDVRRGWNVQVQGKIKGEYSKKIHLFLGQRYKEDGAVLRYVKIEKAWTLGFIEGNDGPEMYNAAEEISGVEVARAYFEPGKKVQIDYHKHDLYRNEDFWDDCNLYGLADIDIKAAPIMPETYEELKNTIFRYSGLKEYDEQAQEVNPIRYLQNYQKTPQIEILAKLGLSEIVKGINEGTPELLWMHLRKVGCVAGNSKGTYKKAYRRKGRCAPFESSADRKEPGSALDGGAGKSSAGNGVGHCTHRICAELHDHSKTAESN